MQVNQQLGTLASLQPGRQRLRCNRGDLMTINCKGRVNVVTPGTPVPLSTNPTATASKLFFQVIPGLTGKTYVGAPAMSKTTLSSVARVLWPNSAGGFSETFYIE